MSNQRIIAIGDIHGCVHALDTLLDVISPGPHDQVVVLGDFIDQGRESRLVIDTLLQLRDRCTLICLEGNHEEMLLAARTNPQALRYWELCGGVPTLNSYRFGGTLADIPPEHWEFVAGCRDFYETADHIFVHANYDAALALDGQEPRVMRWELLDSDVVRPHLSGKQVIVGHTEQSGGEVLDLGCVQCIDTACWRYGWLTALDVTTGQIWQASRFGQLRESHEPAVGPIGQRPRAAG